MEAATDRPLLRIGELSRRVGVSGHLLRAWESRYGLLQPVRSPGGFRLYSETDETRIRCRGVSGQFGQRRGEGGGRGRVLAA